MINFEFFLLFINKEFMLINYVSRPSNIVGYSLIFVDPSGHLLRACICCIKLDKIAKIIPMCMIRGSRYANN